MEPPNDNNLNMLDRVTFLLLFSFAPSAVLKFIPKGGGSSDDIMLLSLSSAFGLLTIIFLVIFVVRAVTRWWRIRRRPN